MDLSLQSARNAAQPLAKQQQQSQQQQQHPQHQAQQQQPQSLIHAPNYTSMWEILLSFL